MNGTKSTPKLGKLRLSLKWAWAGPSAGIACMLALFIAGIVTHSPGMTVVSASVAAALAGIWVSVYASLRRKIEQEERA